MALRVSRTGVWGVVLGVLGACGGRTDLEFGAELGAAAVPPTLIQGTTGATQVALGKYHGCSLQADGSVACWSLNECTQRGDGGTAARHFASPVPNVADAVEIAAGNLFSCARLNNGSVKCWGVFGDGCGRMDLTQGPQPIPSVTTAVEIAGNKQHACARLADGSDLLGLEFAGRAG